MSENHVATKSMGRIPKKTAWQPYQHQIYNHLFFDRIRAVQLEVEFMKAYLEREESSRIGGAGLKREISTLEKISSLLFDGVYKPIREKWV